ncbi:DUF2070 family protein, partial [Candidatus Bathyarchaeota archaeon]|nr:DUF2070 family protein [Candidatus Bathyarchaeota archaeon]
MNSALKHYSSMFFLPTFKKALVAIAVICIGVVGFSTFALFPSVGLINSLFLGISLFAVTLIVDYVMSKIVLGRDPIYVLRRTVALSLFCWVLWLFFIILGVVFGAVFDLWWWIKLCLLGFAAVLTLRTVVFTATSSARILRRLLSSLLQPFLCIIAFMIFWASLASAIPLQVLPFLVISPIVGCASAFLFLFLLDRLGRRTYGMYS